MKCTHAERKKEKEKRGGCELEEENHEFFLLLEFFLMLLPLRYLLASESFSVAKKRYFLTWNQPLLHDTRSFSWNFFCPLNKIALANGVKTNRPFS